jgi:tRNA modification GTPase
MANQSARVEGVVADTIAAAATAAGRAAIAVVRISGPDAQRIGEQICGRSLTPRRAALTRLATPDGEAIDDGIALFFPRPASFTGEDVVELQCHGSPIIVDWLLETIYRAGARPAEPGEFSLRAYLNGKVDLTQAEAIADLIESGSRSAARAALHSLSGHFSARVAELQQQLTALRVLCESWLDFPDEDIDHAAQETLDRHWRTLRATLDRVERDAIRGRKLNDGVSIAIAGRPNAGKSSLLNDLAGTDSAIVTEVPGTTRDTIRETIELGGITITLTDMAGLRETSDPIEGEGVRRAEAEIARADHVLWVADIRDGIEAAEAAARRVAGERPFALILNKIDLIDGKPNQFDAGMPVLALSAKTGAGVDALRAHLAHVAGLDDDSGGVFSARRRQVEALAAVRRHVDEAGPHLTASLEIAAEELKAAQACLDELTGEHTSDDLLGEIFSTFCIGK